MLERAVMSDYARPTGSQPIEMTDMREVHQAGENGTNQRASSITTDDDEEENDTLPTDPFEPFGDVEPATGSILTFRALIVGCFCGTLVNASNLYLGLKAGWTVSANIFGSIIGFALLQPLTSYLSSLGYNNQHFGPQENNIVQTAATAAGGLSNVFVSAIPALYQLGLLATPSKDFARLVAITAAGGYFGLLSAAPSRGLWQALKARRKKDYAYTTIGGEKNLANENNIRLWMWLPGLVVTIAVTCFITSVQFEMSVAETLLALTLAFLLSLLAIHASGATDTVPLSSLSKVTQVVLGGTTQGSASIESAQRLNLLVGALTNIGANQACDLMGDFRVGFLLGTSPRLQYAAQMIGTLVAALVAPTMFLIFASAYPCILSTEETGEGGDHQCEFPAPSVAAWRAIVLAVTRPESPIPQSSWVFSIVMAVLASVMVLAKNLFTGKWTSIQPYYPNMVIVAMAFTLPSTQYGTAMLIGAVIASVWKKKRPDGFEKYAYAVAAGAMAGEGIGGVVNAILSGIGLDGGTFGTTVGTP
ncbi:hypothetical protein APSETT444_008985 [Aspergillus pseudonomiae]